MSQSTIYNHIEFYAKLYENSTEPYMNMFVYIRDSQRNVFIDYYPKLIDRFRPIMSKEGVLAQINVGKGEIITYGFEKVTMNHEKKEILNHLLAIPGLEKILNEEDTKQFLNDLKAIKKRLEKPRRTSKKRPDAAPAAEGGAMMLEDMNVKQLHEICSRHHISYSGKRKAELIAVLRKV